MADVFTRLADRARGDAGALTPRLPARFEAERAPGPRAPASASTGRPARTDGTGPAAPAGESRTDRLRPDRGRVDHGPGHLEGYAGRADPGTNAGRAGPGTFAGRADPGGADPGHTDQGRTDQGRTDQGHTGPRRNGPALALALAQPRVGVPPDHQPPPPAGGQLPELASGPPPVGRVRPVPPPMPAVPAGPRRAAGVAASPTVHITIGRIEVRAAAAAPAEPSRPPRAAAPPVAAGAGDGLSLAAYLRGDDGRPR